MNKYVLGIALALITQHVFAEDAPPNPPSGIFTPDHVVSNASELNSVLSSAVGGEKILLKDGNYGSLTINKLYSDYVVLRSQNQYGAVFSGLSIDGSKGYVQFDRISSSGSDARNGANHLKFTNSKFSGLVYFRVASDVLIENSIINVDGSLHALLANSLSNFTISKNLIAYAQEDLMRITADSDTGTVEYNVFWDTKPQNIPTADDACAYNHSDAMQFFGSSGASPRNITIRGNVFYDNPSNNAVRPTSCGGSLTNMQGIFVSDPSGGAYENFLIEDNLLYLGSANSIYVNSAGSNYIVRNNTLLPWETGRGGSIRIVEKSGYTNKALQLYGNVASSISDETSSISNGMTAYNNYVYERSESSASNYKDKLYPNLEDTGMKDQIWQWFVPATGSVVDYGSGYGALSRLKNIESKISTPIQWAP